MTMKLYDEEDIQDIANAIRSKNGQSTTYTVSEMGEAVRNISGGGGAVESVNGQTGVVVLDADDVGALPDNYSETDPVFTASAAHGISSSDITAWNAKYDKPSGGIPKTDLASGVQTSLGLADTAYQKPSGGIPDTDIASASTWNAKSDFSGSYNDLTDKPTIPTVNNATLTIQKNGTTVNTFTANASSNVTANITVPTNVSDLNNDSGFITGIDSTAVTTALGYTPYDGTTNPNGYVDSTGAASAAPVASVNGQTGTVSLSIPSKTSDLTNDSNFMSGMTILSYGNSTWSDFETAYSAKHVVYTRASSNSNPASGSQTRLAFMAYVNNAETPTEVEFQYYRSVSSHSANQQGDQVYVYKLTKTAGWTVTVRESYTKIVAGTGLTSSYSNGVLTISLA